MQPPIIKKLVSYFDRLADEAWKMYYLQFPTTKFQILLILIPMFVFLAAIAADSIRHLLQRYARSSTPNYNDLGERLRGSDLEMEERDEGQIMWAV